MRNLPAALFLILPLGLCTAQSAPTKPVEPAAIGVVYRLDPSTHELKPLPDEPWKLGHHTSFPFLLDSIEVKQEHSLFRVRANESLQFVFKVGSPEKVSLYRFVEKGKKRYFDVGKGNGSSSDQPIKGLPVEVTSYGERSYQLSAASPLSPGEYAINIADEVYTFGVDQ
jgi:hypothetical protein